MGNLRTAVKICAAFVNCFNFFFTFHNVRPYCDPEAWVPTPNYVSTSRLYHASNLPSPTLDLSFPQRLLDTGLHRFVQRRRRRQENPSRKPMCWRQLLTHCGKRLKRFAMHSIVDADLFRFNPNRTQRRNVQQRSKGLRAACRYTTGNCSKAPSVGHLPVNWFLAKKKYSTKRTEDKRRRTFME